MNVVAVNCEEHRKFCQKEGIEGYPTIRLLVNHLANGASLTWEVSPRHSFRVHWVTNSGQDEIVRPESSGEVSDERASSICWLTSRASLQLIKLEDFEDIVKTEEAFFLYLQNFDTEVSDLVSCHELRVYRS